MEREKFLILERKEAEYKGRVADLEAKIPNLEIGAAELDAVAFKAEVIDESGWKDKRKAADRAKEHLATAKEEPRKSRQGLGIMVNEKGNILESIRAEVMAEYRPKFGKALKEFYAKLLPAVIPRVGVYTFVNCLLCPSPDGQGQRAVADALRKIDATEPVAGERHAPDLRLKHTVLKPAQFTRHVDTSPGIYLLFSDKAVLKYIYW
jgi:hypothetical protein